MATAYGFPKQDLRTAIAAADDLARRYRDGTARRVNPDGSIDLAAMEGFYRRRFHLYRVSREGAAALVETSGSPRAYKLAVAMIVGGAAVFASATVHAILFSNADSTGLGIGIVGFVACLVGVIRSNRFGLEWYVRERFGSDSGWQQLFAPTKWAPRSVGQLHAVERLAHDHAGKAYARPHPDGGTEVRTLHRGRLHEYVVTPDGTVLLFRRGRPAPSYAVGVAAMAIGAGGAVVTTLLYNLTDLDVTPAFYVSLGLFFVGTTLRSVTLRSRVKDRVAGGWHLVQTKPDDTD